METKIAKIGASTEADGVLDRMLHKINDGFTGGRVTKNDLASWIILYFEKHSLDGAIDKIRKDHFDQLAYLESVVKEMKQARKSGSSMPDINALLAPVASQIKLISAQDKPGSKRGRPKLNSDQNNLSTEQAEIKAS